MTLQDRLARLERAYAVDAACPRCAAAPVIVLDANASTACTLCGRAPLEFTIAIGSPDNEHA